MKYAKETGPVDITPPTLYMILATGTKEGPLAGQFGFLAEDGKRLYFRTKEAAGQKIQDLQNRCMNRSPAAVYKRVIYPCPGMPDHSITAEAIGSYDLRPGFDPFEYQLQDQDYGNTGGRCMVGSTSYLLPSLNRTVWLDCNDEGVSVFSADQYGSWERYEDVLLLTVQFTDTDPGELGPWLPMVLDTLAYTAAQQTALGMTFQIPESWRNALEEQGQPPGPAMDAPC